MVSGNITRCLANKLRRVPNNKKKKKVNHSFWAACGGMKESCCLFIDFYYLFWFIQETIFCFFLFHTWCSIYFGAPISTKFRSIWLPHRTKLVRTCWFFSRLSEMKGMKHGYGEENRAVEPFSHLREDPSYKDIQDVHLSH